MNNTQMQNFHSLCVGADPNFISYLLTAADSINLSLDVCKTIKDAQEKIGSLSYDLCVISLNLSEKAVDELVHEIRKKETKKSIVVILSETPQAGEYSGFLTDKQLVDFVLQKPINPQEIDNLIKALSQGSTPQTAPAKSNKLQELRLNYEKTIYNKIETLTELIKAVQANPDEEHYTKLRVDVHKISGSAGSFGYGSVSVICKEMDIELSNRIKAGNFQDRQWLLSLDEFLQKVKSGFQISSSKEPEIILTQLSRPHPILYVIDPDIDFLNLLVRVNEQFPIQLLVESNPEAAVEKLKSPEFNPGVIIVSSSLPSTSITPFDIIEVQRRKKNKTPFISALLLDNDSIDKRVEATNRGINYLFHKPVSAYTLLKFVQDALEIETLKQIKVLVLDDDPDFCQYVIAVLTEIGVSVQAIYDSTNLLKTLEEYHPNILLLDLVLPKYDGIHLLKSLRQDVAYKNLIVVIVTSSEEASTTVNAYSANADDILYKPLDKTILQKRVLNLAERQDMSVEISEPENYTGLSNHKSLMAELHECLIKSKRQGFYLVLFEIDEFADRIMEKGRAATKDLLVSLSNQLQWSADHRMKCFSYASSIFAIIFNDANLEEIEVKMYEFLQNCIKNEKTVKLTFNCSIVPISKAFGNPQQILQEGEQGLKDAHDKDAASVKITTRLPKEKSARKREVVIIDADVELNKILKWAFESHGLMVKTYFEGGEAFKELSALPGDELPSLIISERKLPDMDGLDLFLRLKEHFRFDPPFFIVTVFSSDKDVSDGLRSGVLEYIIKPFNISILVQKALKVIFREQDYF